MLFAWGTTIIRSISSESEQNPRSEDLSLTNYSVAIPLNARLLAELFSLNVKTSTNESAAHTSSELYTLLLNVRNWVDYPHADLSTMWYRRRKAQEASAVLTKSTKDSFSRAVEKPWSISSWLWGTEVEATSQSTSVLKDVGAEIAESIQQIAGSHEDSAKLAWMLATSNIGNPVAAVSAISLQRFEESMLITHIGRRSSRIFLFRQRSQALA